jgi:hypothetical protein
VKSANHAMVLVGYGRSDSGVDYWVIANSWGTSFCNYGFIAAKMTTKPSMIFSDLAYCSCDYDRNRLNPRINLNVKNMEKAAEREMNSSDRGGLDLLFGSGKRTSYFSSYIGELGMTHDGNLSQEELSNFYSNLEYVNTVNQDVVRELSEVPFKNRTTFGWYSKEINPYNESFCSEIRSQGSCGSCWSFATVYFLQSMCSIKYYYLSSLSPSETVVSNQSRNIWISVQHMLDTRHLRFSKTRNMCTGDNANVALSDYVPETGVLAEDDCNYECSEGQKTELSGQYSDWNGCDGNDDCQTGLEINYNL